MEIILTDRFLGRIEEFSDYIALNDIPTAVNWANEIFDQCEQLRSHPESGRIVPEFGQPEIRELIHGNYRLIYEVKTNQVDMLTIWHTSQELPDKPE
ncbi:type II toxin-antitoxin system RelE/ParE family toxin [Fodinibius halophilus]|uniref:Type II toxin-antitoxin system RelE/ParE family toxin n=1 Tax=Fodinibius halophilus TaxID=1736908 RepID=A0A6M1TBF9_9BACT|nr:type II toxin-antitoxin system RelE/ParE family toxin [Fodinibius halophilus]NGP89371.1 type II toxin-antitoxin system RelE/ParE family toxin [Fodinibius halophilus]